MMEGRNVLCLIVHPFIFKAADVLKVLQHVGEISFEIEITVIGPLAVEQRRISINAQQLIERELEMITELLNFLQRNGLLSAYAAVRAIRAYGKQLRHFFRQRQVLRKTALQLLKELLL